MNNPVLFSLMTILSEDFLSPQPGCALKPFQISKKFTGRFSLVAMCEVPSKAARWRCAQSNLCQAAGGAICAFTQPTKLTTFKQTNSFGQQAVNKQPSEEKMFPVNLYEYV